MPESIAVLEPPASNQVPAPDSDGSSGGTVPSSASLPRTPDDRGLRRAIRPPSWNRGDHLPGSPCVWCTTLTLHRATENASRPRTYCRGDQSFSASTPGSPTRRPPGHATRNSPGSWAPDRRNLPAVSVPVSNADGHRRVLLKVVLLIVQRAHAETRYSDLDQVEKSSSKGVASLIV